MGDGVELWMELGHMSDTCDLPMSKPELARRVEVFTGAGRRRSWSTEDKAAIIAESYTGSDTVSGVARRHGLTGSQLFAWRRDARRADMASAGSASMFVPAVMEAAPAADEVPAKQALRGRPRRAERISGIIEIKTGWMTVRIERGADVKAVAAVMLALKAAR